MERFWSKVEKTDTCWIWKGSVNWKGYGFYRYPNGQYAHRFVYQLHYGKKPGKKLVLHSCDNPPCVNPEHLRLGTNDENMAEMGAKGRSRCSKKTHCVKGHPLAGSNLYVDPRGYRECKECRRDNVRKFRGA